VRVRDRHGDFSLDAGLFTGRPPHFIEVSTADGLLSDPRSGREGRNDVVGYLD
jgi:hypothetical protein